MSKTLSLTLACVLLVSQGRTEDGDLPTNLDSNNFYDIVLDSETNLLIGQKPWFVEFFAPWCPHCQHLNPIWDELHTRVKDKVNIGRVDCTSPAGKTLCSQFSIRGYPTLLFFQAG